MDCSFFVLLSLQYCLLICFEFFIAFHLPALHRERNHQYLLEIRRRMDCSRCRACKCRVAVFFPDDFHFMFGFVIEFTVATSCISTLT